MSDLDHVGTDGVTGEDTSHQDAGLQAKTIWAELNRRHGNRFSVGQVRTLQRKLSSWGAKAGPDREVFFSQVHVPGEQGQSDFTDMREIEIVIAGEKFAHLLYHFVLTYSNWESVSTCPSESFEALSAGMQTAFWRLGGIPTEHRTDNLSRHMNWPRVVAGISPSDTAN